MAEEQTHEEEHSEDLALTEEESEGVSGGHAKRHHETEPKHESMYSSGGPKVIVDEK